MIEFIDPTLYISLTYNQYSAFADLHILQFTAAQALKYSVYSSRILTTDLNTGTISLLAISCSIDVSQPYGPPRPHILLIFYCSTN
jgi:hypothetical protein